MSGDEGREGDGQNTSLHGARGATVLDRTAVCVDTALDRYSPNRQPRTQTCTRQHSPRKFWQNVHHTVPTRGDKIPQTGS